MYSTEETCIGANGYIGLALPPVEENFFKLPVLYILDEQGYQQKKKMIRETSCFFGTTLKANISNTP